MDLTKTKVIGEGLHKIVYEYPGFPNKCIKLLKDPKDKELAKELKYRKILKFTGKKPSMLPKFYGSIETEQGTGYVFERILDFNGEPSIELMEVFNNPDKTTKIFNKTPEEIISKFKQLMFEEKILVSNIDPYNYIIQRTSPTGFTFKAIDNIGSPALIPLACFFNCIAQKRMQKYWRIFEKNWLNQLKSETVESV